MYGIAIAGTGWVAGAHLAAIANDPRGQVVAVAGSNRSKAIDFCRLHSLSANPYGDFEQLLADPRVDVVFLATPNNLHSRQTIAAAQAGKHLLIEKPAALDADSLERSIAAVERAGVTSLVGFVLHWNPMFDLIKSQLRAGLLGQVFYAEINYWHQVGDWYSGFAWASTRAGGGNALLCAGCHAVDALRYFTSSEITSLTALATDDGSGHEYPSTMVFICELSTGAIGKVSASLGARLPYQFDVDLLGTKGSIRNNRLYSKEFEGLRGFSCADVECPNTAEVASHPFNGEVAHLFDCLDAGVDTQLSLRSTRNTHQACIAAEISASEGRTVRLPLEP